MSAMQSSSTPRVTAALARRCRGLLLAAGVIAASVAAYQVVFYDEVTTVSAR
ncbi:MAG: hypothetical protein ACI89J_003468 [Hyphomicrobiaceae bacterium]|jgi:hypothetical protein